MTTTATTGSSGSTPSPDAGVVVVTGGGSGIGRATAQRVARKGAAVAVLDRDAQGAEQTVRSIDAAGGRASSFPVDVSDDAAVAGVLDDVSTRFGRVTGVVTCAGIFRGPDLQLAHLVPVEDFLHVIMVNLVGTFTVIRAALPHLIDGGGAIVTVASTAAIRGHGQGAGYTASKGGVDALTRLLAVQYGPVGVRANCVCPGGVDTPMSAGAFRTEQALDRAKRAIPLGRYAQADDIGDVIVFLLSDQARHVTGQTIPVDGGSTVR